VSVLFFHLFFFFAYFPTSDEQTSWMSFVVWVCFYLFLITILLSEETGGGNSLKRGSGNITNTKVQWGTRKLVFPFFRPSLSLVFL